MHFSASFSPRSIPRNLSLSVTLSLVEAYQVFYTIYVFNLYVCYFHRPLKAVTFHKIVIYSQCKTSVIDSAHISNINSEV